MTWGEAQKHFAGKKPLQRPGPPGVLAGWKKVYMLRTTAKSQGASRKIIAGYQLLQPQTDRGKQLKS